MRAKKALLTLLVGVIVGLGIAAAIAQPEQRQEPLTDVEFFEPLVWLIHEIEGRYVDKVDRHELQAGAMQGILSKLDEYSTYMAPETLNYFQSDQAGEFGGLGIKIRFDPLQKAVIVDQTIPGTPAFEKGMRADDLIVEIYEQATDETIKTSSFKDVYDAVKVLRGEPGTAVTLTVLRMRGEEREQVKVTITRSKIEIPAVRAVELVDPEGRIGYIYIAHFHRRLVEDITKAIEHLRQQGAQGLILDLRFNPGGLLPSAQGLASLFLDHKLIVRVEGRVGSVQLLNSVASPPYPDIPLAVLVNKDSASASEIVAAALSDNKRAVVVGQPTHGKASVQALIPIPLVSREDAVKLTVAHYYTPSDQPIAEKGVQPDVIVEISQEELETLAVVLSRKTAFPAPDPDQEPADTEQDADAEGPPPDWHDAQLERAVVIVGDMLKEADAGEPAVGEAVPSGA